MTEPDYETSTAAGCPPGKWQEIVAELARESLSAPDFGDRMTARGFLYFILFGEEVPEEVYEYRGADN